MAEIKGALERIEKALDNALFHVERDWRNIHVEISRPAGETRSEIKQALADIQAIRDAVPDGLAESMGDVIDMFGKENITHPVNVAATILQQITEKQTGD